MQIIWSQISVDCSPEPFPLQSVTARQDALRRLEAHFAGQTVDAIDAHSYVHELRTTARHYFGGHGAAPASPVTPPPLAPGAGRDKPRRPQPVELTPAQIQEVQSITNPAQRLTRYRELQEQA